MWAQENMSYHKFRTVPHITAKCMCMCCTVRLSQLWKRSKEAVELRSYYSAEIFRLRSEDSGTNIFVQSCHIR